MHNIQRNICRLMAGASLAALGASAAAAGSFDIPGGELKAALDSYARQTGVSLVVSDAALKGVQTPGVRGQLSDDAALSRLLSGTGFAIRRYQNSAITLVREQRSENERTVITPIELAQAAPAVRAVETVTVTSSKLGGADVQSIPISITALSQEQLTSSQTNGGPDLIKQVPNMTFTKTNFSGYSIQLRGIGTQAISVTTDPAVAVAFNDTPFIRNHFFEQEFYDVAQVEVLRGPQGTLYGRNATAGVVNITSAKPTDQFEAMASGEVGNFGSRRFEGMINIPISDDYLDIRAAGEWTKRNGYALNEYNNSSIDGRNLWSSRLSIGWKPVQ
ncbi:MAG TPA: TonB-dependent receptor, partial [Rhizomicrobium sp.]|nr:TonB-dependent receptor [Rhizomicrobium sp.]